MNNVLFVVDGPSGAGKSYLLRYAETHCDRATAIPKLTTRPRRAGEADESWSDLIHVTKSQFAETDPDYRYTRNGYDYGLTRPDLTAKLAEARSCFVVVRDLATIRRLTDDFPHVNVVPVFVLASHETRERRLQAAGFDPAEVDLRQAWDEDPAGHYAKNTGLYRLCLQNDRSLEDFHRLINEMVAEHVGAQR
jgi:guanylate kinase